jgi:hypothetical protein
MAQHRLGSESYGDVAQSELVVKANAGHAWKLVNECYGSRGYVKAKNAKSMQ